ncbi:MAG TPA: hypothetical protein VGS57_01415 [Thermoanaerobaculia bacterium]|nr:hypothetical protein [Thermoanaerobaculia bacterium]
MIPQQPAPRRLSVGSAASEAMDLVRARLFPFRLDRWLPLGFVTFLDRCGRTGGGPTSGGSGRLPGSSSDIGNGGPSVGEVIQNAKDWIGEHLLVVVAISAIVLVLIVTIIAIVLWLNSRGVFMYADNVASGRFDIARPWREHAGHAWSYFGWTFGLSLVGCFGALVLVAPIVLFVISLFSSGASPLAILGIIALGLLLILWAIVVNLFSLVLRDFAAPLQMLLDVRCGKALGVASGIVRANVGSFVIYVVLKMVFAIVAGITALLAGCFTCCLGFLPVIHHTLLQPLYYFERAWSLCLLRQAGYDLFPAPPPPEPPPAPLAPPEPLPVLG